jgi:aryl-alcohol dehydrogenase-like predicted oxidoreductase
MINAWGNWQLFQELLTVLKAIADSYHVTIPNVAVRYVLEQKAVAGAIIGVRLGVAEHIQENARIFDFQLSPQDYQKIDHVLQKSQDLLQLIGDCGDEYRR